MNKFLKSYLAILVPVYVLHFTFDGNESIVFVLFWLPLMLLFLTFLGILASGLLADHRGVEHKWVAHNYWYYHRVGNNYEYTFWKSMSVAQLKI